MKISKQYERIDGDDLEDIKEYLEGRIFHVTKIQNFPLIKELGEIRANTDGQYVSTFGSSYNSYFKNHGCISVFDYRDDPNELIHNCRTSCSPFLPAQPPSDGIAIFIFNDQILDKLLTWKDVKPDVKSSTDSEPAEIIVPFVESGYPKSIPINYVKEVISLKRVHAPIKDVDLSDYKELHNN